MTWSDGVLGIHTLAQLRTALGVLDRKRRDGIEYPIWSTVHALAVLTGQGPRATTPMPPGITSSSSSPPSSRGASHEPHAPAVNRVLVLAARPITTHRAVSLSRARVGLFSLAAAQRTAQASPTDEMP